MLDSTSFPQGHCTYLQTITHTVGSAWHRTLIRACSFCSVMQEVLLKLEADIAALPMGQDGFTAPGVFIFELLAKVNLKEETFGFMLQLLDQGMSLLSDEALAAGRK